MEAGDGLHSGSVSAVSPSVVVKDVHGFDWFLIVHWYGVVNQRGFSLGFHEEVLKLIDHGSGPEFSPAPCRSGCCSVRRPETARTQALAPSPPDRTRCRSLSRCQPSLVLGRPS